MKRWSEALLRLLRGLSEAISRFPLTVVCLGLATIFICYMISLHRAPDLVIQKLMFTFLVGSFLGVAAQFGCERFERLARLRIGVYLVAVLLIGGYYLILASAPGLDFEVSVRTAAAIFAMFCVFIWIPSYRGNFDFNKSAFIHFKSALTAAAYSGVLSAGCAAVIAAVDILLVKLNSDIYGYTMTVIWVFFAEIYYLSLLPHFNSNDRDQRDYAESAAQYHATWEILVSYIAIPLVAAYTLVLAAYFIKILVTLTWPSGQLGVMVLAYSAAGLIIFILASLIENRFAYWYRVIFPKALIPIVIMQMISVVIRLNAYGVTESRYYVVIFGIFTLTCAVWLSFQSVTKNGLIAVLAAACAIFSVIPPVDAFTVSRSSQINRLETMLTEEGVLADGKLHPKAEVPFKVRAECTNILYYLENHHYLEYVQWLPRKLSSYEDIKSTLGFEPGYAGEVVTNFYANVSAQTPFDISGYDICVNADLSRYGEKAAQPEFEVRAVKYKLDFKRVSPQEVYISVKDGGGEELVGTGLYDFAKSVAKVSSSPKEAISPDQMTFTVEKNGYKLRVMFQNLNINEGSGTDAGVDYSALVMFGAP